jgi:ribosomal-protein-alanine N-acetyltransferase
VWQDVDGPAELEIGYHVHANYRNRGLATEAARAVRDYAFATLAVDHVISLIRPENLPSRRVAEKNGLTLDRTVFWRGYDHCVYRLAKPIV